MLKGKRAVITGSNSGIGLGVAEALAAAGAEVILNSFTDRPEDHALAAELGARHGVASRYIAADMSKAAECRALVGKAGGCDILVNNAGGSRSFKDLHVSEEQWQEALTLNFHRPRQLGDALIDQMIARQWGRIINITGKSEPEHINGAFCAKAGMHSWAKGLSRMVGKHGITVNCIPPGRIHSEQIFRNYTPEYRQWQCDNEIPVGRYGEPEDLANLVTFLASPRASYITGAVIPVDGGLRKYQF